MHTHYMLGEDELPLNFHSQDATFIKQYKNFCSKLSYSLRSESDSDIAEAYETLNEYIIVTGCLPEEGPEWLMENEDD